MRKRNLWLSLCLLAAALLARPPMAAQTSAAAQSAVERRRITIGVRQNASPPGQPAF